MAHNQEEASNIDYSNYPTATNQNDMSDSFLKAMIEVEETLQKFEYETLRRKRLKIDTKNKTKTWVPISPDVPQICNELGIAEILGFLRGRATVIARLTKKTDEEVMRDMFQFHEALKDLICLRCDDWEMEEELTKMITESCLSLVEDIIFSARGGFTSINLRSQYSRHEQSNSTPDGSENVKTILGMKVGR